MVTEEMVLEAMKDVYDPEIPVNVVDLGLVYDLRVEGDVVHVTMTMTAPGCPFGDHLAMDAREKIIAGTGARDAQVTMVTSPPWTPEMMSDDARKALGWF
ncbi:MAG: metal-sulfur cluster assembly factor [Chloroflexi bacterium]|nr:metal-sulfur cluster assembly factor [Chloroflexota bacterium]